MLELLEQEAGGVREKSQNAPKNMDEEIKTMALNSFKSQKLRLVNYLNSPLSMERFEATKRSYGKSMLGDMYIDKERSEVKIKIIETIDNTPIEFVHDGLNYAMQYVFGVIKVNFDGLKKYESRQGDLVPIAIKSTQEEMDAILYHELLHVTWLYM